MDSVQKIFMSPGNDLGPVLVVPRTIIVFVVAIVYVRWAKKRFIAQASAMDLVMAVVFGSILSRAINGGATLASSLAAGLTLVALQRLSAHFSSTSRWFSNLVKGTCEVIVRDGCPDRKKMSQHDVTDEDLHQEMRIHALIDDIAKVKLAVLERSGQISVIKQANE